jgi:hypothetical protein
MSLPGVFPRAALSVLAAPFLGVAVMLGLAFYRTKIRRPSDAGIGTTFRFTVTDSGIEWWFGELRFPPCDWGDVLRCHRAETGFLVCSSQVPPIWLPVHAFRDPAAVNQFADLARGKAKTYTSDTEPGVAS